MLTYEKAIKNQMKFKRITGMSPPEFDLLYADVEKKYREAEFERRSAKPRQRSVGAGRNFALSLKDQLLMLLFYYRTYTTQIVVGTVFSVGQATVSRNIAYLEPVVRECIPIPERVYESVNQIQTIEELEETIPGLLTLTDASEQQIYRPKKNQKKYYSGKKKRHTMKTQYTVAYNGKIVHTSPPKNGSVHDYKVFKEHTPNFPSDLPHKPGIPPEARWDRHTRVRDMVDGAYTGMEKQFPERDVRVSIKRKPGKKLTPEEKDYNKKLAKIRVRAEHVIGRVKVFRVMQDRFRNPRKKYGIINDIVCGLVNMLRVQEMAAT